MRKILLIGGIVLAGMLILAVFNFFNQPQGVSGALEMSNATDLIGTKVGTTTTGADFRVTANGGQSASTTYPFFIGGAVENIVITLKVKAASSTANVRFAILASSDTNCDTASTTSTYANIVLVKDINWFDAYSFIKDSTVISSYAAGTSTIEWTNPKAGTGKLLTLTDVNANCLALQVSGSSTSVWAQYKFRGSY